MGLLSFMMRFSDGAMIQTGLESMLLRVIGIKMLPPYVYRRRLSAYDGKLELVCKSLDNHYRYELKFADVAIADSRGLVRFSDSSIVIDFDYFSSGTLSTFAVRSVQFDLNDCCSFKSLGHINWRKYPIAFGHSLAIQAEAPDGFDYLPIANGRLIYGHYQVVEPISEWYALAHEWPND